MLFSGLEQLEHTPGEEALQAASDLTVRLALRTPALDVTLRLLVTSPTDEHRAVEGAVELAVTGSVEPVADRLARRCGDWRDAGQGGERGLGAGPPRTLGRRRSGPPARMGHNGAAVRCGFRTN